MIDYLEMIKRLEEQNMNPDLSEAQREANRWRISFLKAILREKPSEDKINSTDVILERLKDNTFTYSPASLLRG